MSRKTLLLSLVVLVMACSPVLAGLNDKISIDFRDADIRDIAKIISQKAGLNIVAEKSVRGNVTIRLTNVSAKAALDVLTRTNGFSWTLYQNTILIADEKKLQEMAWKTRMFPLKFAEPEEVAKALAQLIKRDLKVAIMPSGHGIMVSGAAPTLDVAAEVVATLDRPTQHFTGKLDIRQGDHSLHSFEFTGKVGNNVELKQKFRRVEGKAGAEGNTETSLEVTIFTDKMTPDGQLFGALELSFGFQNSEGGKETSRDYAGHFTATRGKTVKIFSSGSFLPLQVFFTWEK